MFQATFWNVFIVHVHVAMEIWLNIAQHHFFLRKLNKLTVKGIPFPNVSGRTEIGKAFTSADVSTSTSTKSCS